MSAASSPSGGRSSPRPSSCWLIFLDVDGVLNLLEADARDQQRQARRAQRRAEKKKRKDEAKTPEERLLDQLNQASTNDVRAKAAKLPACIPTVEVLKQAIDDAGLTDSIDAALLQNFTRLMHAIGQTTPASAPACTIVLTSTWRLQAKSLLQLTSLLTSLHLACDPQSTPSSGSFSFACHPRPLLGTPDLKGWASRIEEITAFLQARDGRILEAERLLLVDDMDLFAGQTSLNAALLREYQSRTIKLDGCNGLDASALKKALSMLSSASPLSVESLRSIAAFEKPKAPI